MGEQNDSSTLQVHSDELDESIEPSAKRLKVKARAGDFVERARTIDNWTSMATSDGNVNVEPADNIPAASRPKRVRTGCLTCRERHLKCDEGLPDCVNCRKSSRPCKRGVRLNFIDTQVKTPPITPPTQEWEISFCDESREIASEYRGGLSRYAALKQEPTESEGIKQESQFEFSTGMMETPIPAHQQLPSAQPLQAGGAESYSGASQRMSDQERNEPQPNSSSASESAYTSHTVTAPHSHTSYNNPEPSMTPPNDPKASLNSPEELLFMQVFVEEVGLWMDSMDPYKHVRYKSPPCSACLN